jgi:tetratricopeptide (TPR) repeat protein
LLFCFLRKIIVFCFICPLFFEPLQVSSYYDKGSNCIERGQYQRAIEEYNEAIRLKMKKGLTRLAVLMIKKRVH